MSGTPQGWRGRGVVRLRAALVSRALVCGSVPRLRDRSTAPSCLGVRGRAGWCQAGGPRVRGM